MAFGRKRVYAAPMSRSTRPTKRRRFVKRRRGKRSSNFTSQKGSGGGVTFSQRRLNRRAWKRNLWNSSIAQTHYRSNQSAVVNVATTASPATMTVSLATARRFSGNAFWTAAGGAVNPDGGAIPTFATLSDFTIRGGMYGIRIGNTPDALDADKDPLSVIVYHVWTTKNFLSGSLPATANVGWDPTLVADFQTNIGRITMKKTFLLAEGEVMTFERKMPIQKIDQTEYGSFYNEPIWIVMVGTTTSTVAKGLAMTTYYNMSFIGDAV